MGEIYSYPVEFPIVRWGYAQGSGAGQVRSDKPIIPSEDWQLEALPIPEEEWL
jgi:hypothetical protein